MRRILCWALLLFGVLGCSRCSKSKSAADFGQLTERMPADVAMAVVVPDLHVLGQKVLILEKLKVASFGAQLQGAQNAHEYFT